LSSTNFEKLHEFLIQGIVTKVVISLEEVGVVVGYYRISSSCVVTLMVFIIIWLVIELLTNYMFPIKETYKKSNN